MYQVPKAAQSSTSYHSSCQEGELANLSNMSLKKSAYLDRVMGLSCILTTTMLPIDRHPEPLREGRLFSAGGKGRLIPSGDHQDSEGLQEAQGHPLHT
jgi:hypothetical protein